MEYCLTFMIGLIFFTALQNEVLRRVFLCDLFKFYCVERYILNLVYALHCTVLFLYKKYFRKE